MATTREGLASSPHSNESKLPKDNPDEEIFSVADITDFRVRFPKLCKFKDQLVEKDKLEKVTFHQIHQVNEDLPNETRKFYLKDNTPGSHISELEAATAAFYRFLAPNHIAETYAVFDKEKDKYIGVISEEFPHFKSTAQDPITEDDLNTDFLEQKNLSIETLEALDDEITSLKKSLAKMHKKAKRIDLYEIVHDAAFERIKQNRKALSPAEKDSLRRESAVNLVNKKLINDAILDQDQKIDQFYERIAKEHNLTERELEKYQIIKGTAIALTLSYIFEEDDLHQNNWSKFGMRLDFDMSIWPLFYDFKEETLVVLRKPNINTSFKVTGNDIRSFPYINDAKPSYWPTQGLGAFSDAFVLAWKRLFPFSISTNPYPLPINLLYQKIRKNPIFIYHLYSNLAKYLLCNETMFKLLALDHIRKETIYNSALLYGLFAEHQAERLAEFRQILITIPEFGIFFQQHSQRIIKELSTQLTTPELKAERVAIDINADNLLRLMGASPRSQPLVSLSSPSFLFGRKKSVEPKTIQVLVVDAVIKVKTTLEGFLENYLNAWFSNKSYPRIAEELKRYSERIKPDPVDYQKNIETLIQLDSKLQDLLNTKVKNAGKDMHTNLTAVRKLIADSLATFPKQVNLEL